jgi:predicted MFS family arabinose efflux permease
MDTPTTPIQRLNRRLRPLYVSQFFLGFVIWYPIEKLFMREIGFDDAAVGLMAAIYAGLTLLIETPSGILADRWSRKGVLILAGVALLLNALVAGLSTDVATYIASAAILAVFFALNSGTVDSIVYDTVLEEIGDSNAFEERLGRIRVLGSVTSVAGALAGGVLAMVFEPRVTYFLTIPFMAISIAALFGFREPRLNKTAEPMSVRSQVAATYRALTARRALVPVLIALVATSVLIQAVLEFGPLWLVATAAPVFLFGPHGAGLLGSFGIGGFLAGRIGSIGRLASTAFLVVLLVAPSIVLILVADAVVATVAQIVLAAALVAVSIAFTGRLHDAIPSTVRAGVSSAVGSMSWIVFLPFSIVFGVVSNELRVFDAGWLIASGAIVLAVVLVRTELVSRERPVAATRLMADCVPANRSGTRRLLLVALDRLR